MSTNPLSLLKNIVSKIENIPQEAEQLRLESIRDAFGEKKFDQFIDSAKDFLKQLEEYENSKDAILLNETKNKRIFYKIFLSFFFVFSWIRFSPLINTGFAKIYFKFFYLSPDSTYQHPIAKLNPLPQSHKLQEIATRYSESSFSNIDLMIIVPIFFLIIGVSVFMSSFFVELFRSKKRRQPIDLNFLKWRLILIKSFICPLLLSGSTVSSFPGLVSTLMALSGFVFLFWG